MKVGVRTVLLTAFVETILVLATGILIWFALLGVRYLFGLDEIDQDFGLAVRRAVREIGGPSTRGPVEPAHAALFLDVDAQEDTKDANPCRALAAARPDLYRATKLNCSSARPINRFLLARLIEDLDQRSPAAVVLDVSLRRDTGVVGDEENAALESAIARSKFPIVFAVAVKQPALDHENPLQGSVEAEEDQLMVERPPLRLGGVSLPEAEQPVRRYSKCYRKVGGGGWLGNVSFLAAAKLAGREAGSVDALCEHEREVAAAEGAATFAPRIAYTFPSLSLRHITLDAELAEREGLIRARYQDSYARCRAADFWRTEAQCNTREPYEGKVVVIGTSSLLRRDLHQTPLGTMVGAEVVINAIRSFELAFSPQHETEFAATKLETFREGMFDLIASAALWFLYFAARTYEHKQRPLRLGRGALWIRRAILAILFMATLWATVILTVWSGYKSLSIMAGVLGMALERFVEIINGVHKKLKNGLKALFGLAVGVLIFASSARAFALEPGCPNTFAGVEASVTKVDPPGQQFMKGRKDGQAERVGRGSAVCVGESIVLPASGPVRRVELYLGYRLEVVTPSKPFHNKGGFVAVAQQAADFLRQTLGAVRDMRPPPSPGPTESRGGPAEEGAPVRQVRALRTLRELPVQLLTPDIVPLLAWREGKGPYRCEARKDGDWDSVLTVSPAPEAVSCVLTGNLQGVVQLLVIDARSGSETWNIQRVVWTEVPRAPWMLPDLRALSNTDRTAWALWLWKSAAPVWRLQALGMLNQLAPTVWAAGYARDSILADQAVVSPNKNERTSK